jgi:hypothetical protein
LVHPRMDVYLYTYIIITLYTLIYIYIYKIPKSVIIWTLKLRIRHPQMGLFENVSPQFLLILRGKMRF